jgi:hypothetical protein
MLEAGITVSATAHQRLRANRADAMSSRGRKSSSGSKLARKWLFSTADHVLSAQTCRHGALRHLFLGPLLGFEPATGRWLQRVAVANNTARFEAVSPSREVLASGPDSVSSVVVLRLRLARRLWLKSLQLDLGR